MRAGSRSTWPLSRAAMRVGGIFVALATSLRERPRSSRCWVRKRPKSMWSTGVLAGGWEWGGGGLELLGELAALVLEVLRLRLRLAGGEAGARRLDLARARLAHALALERVRHVRTGLPVVRVLA